MEIHKPKCCFIKETESGKDLVSMEDVQCIKKRDDTRITKKERE